MFYYFPHMRHRLDHRENGHISDAVEMEMPGQLLNPRASGR